MFGKICFSLQLENNKEMHFSFLRNLMMMALIVDLKLLTNKWKCFDGQYVSLFCWGFGVQS